MRPRKITIPANSETQLRGNTKRIVVRSAEYEFKAVTDKEEEAVLRRGDNFRFEFVAGFIRLINETNTDNVVVLMVASSDEGDLTATADSTEIVNVDEFNAAAGGCDIRSYTVGPSGVEILSGAVTNRRTAIISPAGPIRIANTQGGTSFTVAGVLNHEASGSLWASADSDTVVEILEYLN